ncbi:MAG: hypothetical protein IJT73_00595 [Selenomonadaceae bacterium]|nr:hypothetical protein [Selenomonadaceae bacterium]
MFKLLNLNTGAVTEVDEPRFVKKKSNGVWIRCDESDAECIAIDGERFSISGKTVIDDAPQIVSISKINQSQKLAQVDLAAIANAKNIDEVKAAINDITDAVLDIYLNGV